jgi:hypothetical protein
MNTYYSGRSSHPARLFSFGLLDGPQGIAVSRNGRLTNSPARTNVALFIHRAVRLAKNRGGLRSQPLRDGIHEQSGLVQSDRYLQSDQKFQLSWLLNRRRFQSLRL